MPEEQVRAQMKRENLTDAEIAVFFEETPPQPTLPERIIHVAYKGGTHYDSVRAHGDEAIGPPRKIPITLTEDDQTGELKCEPPGAKSGNNAQKSVPEDQVLFTLQDPCLELPSELQLATSSEYIRKFGHNRSRYRNNFFVLSSGLRTTNDDPGI